jgi:FkbM family methyltransferase
MAFDVTKALAEASLEIGGVLHVGAHTGQEADTYARLGAAQVVWVEANPEVIPRLKARVEPRGHIVLEALLADEAGRATELLVTSNELASSMLPFGTVKDEHPELEVAARVPRVTETLDRLWAQHGLAGFGLDLLVLDVQGAELGVLRGGVDALEHMNAVWAEVNEEAVYEGCALLPEVEDFLRERGFERTELVLTPYGYGDALFVRPVEARRPRRTVEPVGRQGRRGRAGQALAEATEERFEQIDTYLRVLLDRVIEIETALARIEHEVRLRRQA